MTARTRFMCILVSMGEICFGYDTGQVSGFLEMENFLYNFADQREPTLAFTWRRSGLIVGTLSIETLCGVLISAPIANHPRVGRRLSIFDWCLIFMVGNIIQIAAEYPKWYEIIRIVSGLAIGGLPVPVPMYQGESAPAHIRGSIVCCYQLFITIGILLANLINLGTESISNTDYWRIPLGIDLEEKLAAEETTTGLLEVFKGKRMMYRILLGVGIQAFQHYGTTIFSSVGTSNSFATQIILGPVNVVCTLPGLYMVEKLGRRKCLMLGALWMSICFLMYPGKYRSQSIAFCSASNWFFNFYLAFFTPLITDQIDFAYGYVFAGCNLCAAILIYFFLIGLHEIPEPNGKSLEEIDTMYLLEVPP
ncbi:MFS transporter [Leptodontidium sp. MPI-SDFR-AT-0119]|nr:MFS transporter [Leptodontidium sp. MPI-SDFR-AT-0119]